MSMGRDGRPLAKSYFYRLLKNKTYAGYICKFRETHKGSFEPIVDEETFSQVQRVLKNKGRKFKEHKRDNPDFPLRRFILHPSGKKLTGSWVTGRQGKKFPFYRYDIQGRGYSYHRDDFEKKFKEHMDSFSFKENNIEKLKHFVSKQFNIATEHERGEIERLKTRLQELSRNQNVLVQKNLDGVINDVLLKQQLAVIDKEMLNIQSSLVNAKTLDVNAEEVLGFCQEYLESPSSVWEKANIDTKIKLQRFQFPAGLRFDGKSFETPELSLVFSVNGGSEEKSDLRWSWGY